MSDSGRIRDVRRERDAAAERELLSAALAAARREADELADDLRQALDVVDRLRGLAGAVVEAIQSGDRAAAALAAGELRLLLED